MTGPAHQLDEHRIHPGNRNGTVYGSQSHRSPRPDAADQDLDDEGALAIAGEGDSQRPGKAFPRHGDLKAVQGHHDPVDEGGNKCLGLLAQATGQRQATLRKGIDGPEACLLRKTPGSFQLPQDLGDHQSVRLSHGKPQAGEGHARDQVMPGP